MARTCDICGKGPTTGNKVKRKGLPKKSGGIGLNTVGITRRYFYPNLQRIRVLLNGNTVRQTVCTSCLKRGKVVKS